MFLKSAPTAGVAQSLALVKGGELNQLSGIFKHEALFLTHGLRKA